MILININGPINSGKSTVSKLLVSKLKNSIFIEVDELLSDDEQASLGFDFKEGISERLKRLKDKLKDEIKHSLHDFVIFAYPLNNKNYKEWKSLSNLENPLICITLSPSLDNCLKNRGGRELNAFEVKRIKEMYALSYNCPDNADLTICNDNQTPEETSNEIIAFFNNCYKFFVYGNDLTVKQECKMFSNIDWINAGLPKILLDNMNKSFGFEKIVDLATKEDHENYEHELKFRAPENIINLVANEGLKYKGSYFEENLMFSDPEGLIYENDARLRMRVKEDMHTGCKTGLLTFKKPLKDKDFLGRTELELENPLQTNQVEFILSQFEKANYKIESGYQRIRHTFEGKDILVDIDIFPDIGTFLEIEGTRENTILLSKKLNLPLNNVLNDPYDTIHADWCLSQGNPEIDFIEFGKSIEDVKKQEMENTKSLYVSKNNNTVLNKKKIFIDNL